jgi:hypothetical protein
MNSRIHCRFSCVPFPFPRISSMNFGFRVKLLRPSYSDISSGDGEGVESSSHPIYLRPSLYDHLLTVCTLVGIVFGCVLRDIGS